MADDATVGSVGVEVVPNATDFWKKFKAATGGSAASTGADLGDDLGKAIGDVAGPEARGRLEEALKDVRGSVDLDTAAAKAKIEELQLQIDKLNRGGGTGGGGGGVGGDLGGIGAGAEGAGLSVSRFLLPALAAVATAVGPLATVGAGAFGTLLLGAQGLENQVKVGLTPAFAALQQTATDALGPGINASITELQQAIPQLTPLVNVFGQAIGDEAERFATFLNNGGLQSFVTYANQELPIVEGAFNSALTAGVAFFNAVTPLGNTLLDVLTKAGNGVKFISDKFGEFTLGASGNSTSGSHPSTSDRILNDAGQAWRDIAYPSEVTGPFSNAVGSFSRATTLSLGGSKSALRNEFLNHVTASSALNSQTLQFATNNLAAPSLNSQALHFATNNLGAPSLNSQALSRATAGYGDSSVFDAQQQAKLYAALGTTAAGYGTAKTAADAFTESNKASTLAMQLENNATGILSQALQGLDGNTLGVAQSNTAFHSSISQLNDSLKQNGDTLDINTEKGQANLQSIQAAVAAAQQHAQAIAQQTGSTKQATDAYNADIATLESQIGATGRNKDAIDAYIGSIGKIPPLVTTQLDINAAVAVTAANLGQDVHSAINDITPNQSTTAVKKHALGGMLSEGWNSAGEAGAEFMYKSGANVAVYTAGQSAQMMSGALMPAPSSQRQAAQPSQIIQLVVSGKVLSQVINEQNMQNARA